MGRSRVYCTHPANANRQHNTKTARAIPRKTSFRGSRQSARLQRMCLLYSVPDPPAACADQGARDLGG